MSVVCQFNQHGHCKFGSKCDKFHTIATCANFPCQQDSECNMRHPRLCKYFSAYGRCMFADKCSFLHYSFDGVIITLPATGSRRSCRLWQR